MDWPVTHSGQPRTGMEWRARVTEEHFPAPAAADGLAIAIAGGSTESTTGSTLCPLAGLRCQKTSEGVVQTSQVKSQSYFGIARCMQFGYIRTHRF